ncbi:sensor histidine kinase [Alsobacter sp. R-9]
MVVALVALLPGFAAVAYTSIGITASRRAEVSDLAMRSAQQAASEIASIVAGIESLMLAVSRVPVIRDREPEGCRTFLGDLSPHLPHLVGLAVLSADGRWVCSSIGMPSSNLRFDDRSYFTRALAEDGVVVGEATAGRATGRDLMPLALAIPGRTGAAEGVLVAALDLNWFNDRMRERGVPPGGSLTIADRTGRIIARTPLSERFVGTRIPDGFLRFVTAERPGVEEVMSQDGTRRVLGYVPATTRPGGFYVSAGLSSEASYETVSRAAQFGALLIALGALCTLGVVWLVGSRIFVRPLENLTRVLARRRAGDGMARTGLSPESGEIGELGSQLDSMMDEIDRAQADRELLARELAHRVKNALTTAQALAMSTMNRPTPGRDLLPGYLSRLSALGRMQDALTRSDWDSASLFRVIESVLRPLCPDFDRRVRLRGRDCILPSREALGMTMVLHELATNALKHGALTRPEGTISIEWTVAPATPGGASIDLVWTEAGGPPVVEPAPSSGFGSRLIARALGSAGRAALEFRPEGVVCRIGLRIDAETEAA